MTHLRTGPVAEGCGLVAADGEGKAAPDHRSNDQARYRRCEVCKEPGADVATRMFVAGFGCDHTSYAHAGCVGAAGAGVIAP